MIFGLALASVLSSLGNLSVTIKYSTGNSFAFCCSNHTVVLWFDKHNNCDVRKTGGDQFARRKCGVKIDLTISLALP